MEIKNAVAIITGSSSGIGAAIARLFASQGCHVVINYSRNDAGAKQVAADCEAQGVQTLVRQANVGEDEDCRALVAATLEKFGRLDVLINNAGTTKFCDHRDLAGLDSEDFLDIYKVNTVGAFQMIRAAEDALRQREVAHVINMASIAAITGVGSSIAYAASKGAMLTMTMSLARVLGPSVRVNAICPGFVQGEWLAEGMGRENYERTLAGIRKMAPLADTATPERIAQTALGVVTGMDWTTGEAIIVDGGAHLHTAPLRR
ncbi:SDR family NAD(P)-dependent oxidoreductase [Gilvimarinus sp. F26214L]|uniref:SDR family NAD(P)-dependent oxidoreductase n=1 Tax=Gilvimarinus sp. DZF01 TaxID=3461371 RepID=UPI0040458878